MKPDEETCYGCDGRRLKRVPCFACDLPQSLYSVHIEYGRGDEVPCVCLDVDDDEAEAVA